MCCFSKPVDLVTNTNIFARSAEKGRQFLVYSMTLSSKEDLAMILPLPVPAGTAEDAVRFIDLHEYPQFFADLKSGFPEPIMKSLGRGEKGEAPAGAKAPLAVVEVGEFEASFVPAIKDFSRLDERFRIADSAWEKLPAYKSFGFAVFKLKKGAKTIHPMAFEFPRAKAKELFFPTVHIHDGQVHAKAEFDHSLYCQKAEGESFSLMAWRESEFDASRFVKIDKAKGLVDGARHCHRKVIKGEQKNEDIVL
jgi:hypothetical protein